MNNMTAQSPATWQTADEQPYNCAHCNKEDTGNEFNDITVGFFDKEKNTPVQKRFYICDGCQKELARVLPQKQ